MAERICKNCKHFIQHYVKISRSYSEIFYGHCIYPRLKKRDSDTPACEHFDQRKKQLVYRGKL